MVTKATQAQNQIDARRDEESKLPRAELIRRYRSMMDLASTVTSGSLAAQYAKGASQLKSRHGLTDSEVSR